MKKFLLAMIASLALLSTPTCATFPAVVAAVLTYAQDAAFAIDAIDAFVNTIRATIDEAKLKKIDVAIARARSAADAVVRLAKGAQDIDKTQLNAAFAEFQAAWVDLTALVAPLGVHVGAPGTKLAYTPTGITVPEPLMLGRRE